MGDDSIPNLPNDGGGGDLVPGNRATALADLKKAGNPEQLEELTDNVHQVIPGHRNAGEQSVGLPFEILTKGTAWPNEGEAAAIGVVLGFALPGVGQGSPIQLLILVERPGFPDPLVAALLELVLVIRAQVIDLDCQLPPQDIQ